MWLWLLARAAIGGLGPGLGLAGSGVEHADRADPVGATGCAREQVLGPLDRDVVAEDGPEHAELRPAEAGARLGRLAYRAVVLDEDQVVPVAGHLRHVALRRPDARRALRPRGERVPARLDGVS